MSNVMTPRMNKPRMRSVAAARLCRTARGDWRAGRAVGSANQRQRQNLTEQHDIMTTSATATIQNTGVLCRSWDAKIAVARLPEGHAIVDFRSVTALSRNNRVNLESG